MRQQTGRGYKLIWMSGLKICANPMTKAVFQDEHRRHYPDVLGHRLIGGGSEEVEEKE